MLLGNAFALDCSFFSWLTFGDLGFVPLCPVWLDKLKTSTPSAVVLIVFFDAVLVVAVALAIPAVTCLVVAECMVGIFDAAVDAGSSSAAGMAAAANALCFSVFTWPADSLEVDLSSCSLACTSIP